MELYSERPSLALDIYGTNIEIEHGSYIPTKRLCVFRPIFVTTLVGINVNWRKVAGSTLEVEVWSFFWIVSSNTLANKRCFAYFSVSRCDKAKAAGAGKLEYGRGLLQRTCTHTRATVAANILFSRHVLQISELRKLMPNQYYITLTTYKSIAAAQVCSNRSKWIWWYCVVLISNTISSHSGA